MMIRQSLRMYSTLNANKFFVTTPIFYVNASPHIGHLYSAVIADAFQRYQRIKNPNKEIIFSTGTDEHGTKIQQAAANKKTPVDIYCKNISACYKNTFQLAGIEYTDFIRTSEERHKKSVQNFWLLLKSRGNIYSSQYSGWYCVSDETFLTDSQLKTNPDDTKVSLESGHPVEWTEEINYMFPLNKFQDDVIYWLKQQERIKPIKFEKVLLEYLNETLPDVSVSRPSNRVHWGIPVPNDETQTVYVWLDALVNYLTCAGYPDNTFSNNWPPSLQILGKDILKFHGIYWPAFLIAAGMEPPNQLLVHSHWTVDGVKMSKSKFNVVDPNECSKNYSMEGMRYFLLREGVAHSDGNYSETKILRILNSELADTLGNLLSRGCAATLNPKQIFPKINVTELKDLCKSDSTKYLIESLVELPEKCSKNYESFNFYLVVDQVISTLHCTNNFFETTKPWELKKSSSSNDIARLETIIALTMESLRICGIILQPIIPNTTKKLLDKLNIPKESRYWKNLISFHFDKASSTDLMDAYTKTIDNIDEKSLSKNTDAVLFKRIQQETQSQVKIEKNSVKINSKKKKLTKSR